MTLSRSSRGMNAAMKLATRVWLVAAVSLTLAQPAAPQPPSGRGPDRAMGPPGQDDVQESMALLIVHRMRIDLDLSKEQSLDLLPHLENIEAIRSRSHERRRQIAGKLRALAREPDAAAAEVDTLIRELDQEEERARDEQNGERDAMLALLKPAQRAGFVLFAHRFRDRLQKRMRRMQEGDGPASRDRPRGRGRGRGRDSDRFDR